MNKMSYRMKKYRFYTSILRRTLLIVGLWPDVEPNPIYRLVSYANIACLFLMVAALLNFCYDHKDNLGYLLKAFGLTLSFLTALQKIIWFVCYRERLTEVHNSLADTFGKDFEDNELRPILLSPLFSFYRFSLVLSIVMLTIPTIFACKPIILIIVQLAKGSKTVKYLLPLPASYPWKFDVSSFSYSMHYAFEVYASYSLAAITCGVDALFAYYIFQISGQLRTLSHRMRKLSSKENYRKVIGECIDRHRILARCQANIELIYGPIVLWLSVSSAIVLCSLLYQATHMPVKKIVHVSLYMMHKSMQVFFYGWYGTRLTIENKMFREAIYASDWPGSGEKYLMNNVLIMITYNNKPFILKACSVSTISVEMFIAVCNTAMSYYLMLRTLEDEQHRATI